MRPSRRMKSSRESVMSPTPSVSGVHQPYKLIVAIDYGTTYTGISYVTSNKTSDDIVIVTRWPNHRDQSWKAPSILAYASENQQKISRNHWGYECTRGLKQYAWTKLLLDQHVRLTEHDDPLLRQMYGAEGFLGLPPNKTAEDVVADFMTEVYRHTMQVLERDFAQILRYLPIEVWVTMPAIWSDAAQNATREAALRAGFGSRPGDSVKMITEPEAAALWALKPYLGPTALDPLKPGEYVLICDCGGGTVDLITYEILTVTPHLTHREKCVGTGAKCGATAIDRAFVQWMEAKFGEAYISLDVKKRGPGSLFMQSFESHKRNFGDRSDERDVFEIGPIQLDLDVASIKYDEDEQVVKVARHEMKSFFDPVVESVIKKVEEQKAQLARKNAKINRVVLIGGFGDSPYLNARLKSWCTSNDIRRFTCPTDCQAAIVKGAVLRGLEGIRPTTIVAKRSYGWSWGCAFREGIDDEEDAYHDIYTGHKLCTRMHWAVTKGQEIDSDFKVARTVKTSVKEGEEWRSKLTLYSCPLDVPPERPDHVSIVREGVVITQFTSLSNVDRSKYSDEFSMTVYRFKYDLETNFRAEDGILGFNSSRNGKEVGNTTINFESR